MNSIDLRSRLPLMAVLGLALVLRVYGLEQNGWGADYYSAAVLSMSMSWHNFWFASFDPAGFISVDKPPLSLWIQVLSVKLFGFQPLALLLPQALMGVLSVGLLYHLIQRNFGRAPALIAALLFAITPIAVAVNRSNVTDTTLLLVLLLAGWAMLKATEESNAKRLMLAMALAGLAFNVKMLAGLLLLPVFCLIYLTMAKKPLFNRVRDLAVAGFVLLAVALSWSVFVQLTDPSQRPYIGSSRSNSIFELIVGHNAIERFVSPDRTASQAGPIPVQPVNGQPSDLAPPADGPVATLVRELRTRAFVRSGIGPSRLFGGQLAAQVAWFAPLALMGLIGWIGLRLSQGRRTAAPAEPAQVQSAQLELAQVQLAHRRKISRWFWIGWLLTYLFVYSVLGGIFHFYYVSTLAPAWAALAGIAVASLWRLRGTTGVTSTLLPLLPLVAAAWHFQVQMSAMGWTSMASLWSQPEAWLGLLHGLMLLIALGAACAMMLGRWLAGHGNQEGGLRADKAGLAATVVAIMLLPMAWTLSSIFAPASGVLPSADLYRWQIINRDPMIARILRIGRIPDQSRLIEFLNREQHGTRYILATSTAITAAPLIIATGKAILARGGYHGIDPATTPESLQRLVEKGELRFAMLNDVTVISRRLGADRAGAEVARWIRANGTPVDPALWRNETTRGEAQLYDLRARPGK